MMSSAIHRLLNSSHGIAFLIANNQHPRLEFNPRFELLFDCTPRILGLVLREETPFEINDQIQMKQRLWRHLWE